MLRTWTWEFCPILISSNTAIKLPSAFVELCQYLGADLRPPQRSPLVQQPTANTQPHNWSKCRESVQEECSGPNRTTVIMPPLLKAQDHLEGRRKTKPEDKDQSKTASSRCDRTKALTNSQQLWLAIIIRPVNTLRCSAKGL